MKTTTDALALARTLHQEMIERRRDIHMHPELGFDLPRTAGIVATELQKYGLQVKTGVGKSGVVADLIMPGGKRHIALRADIGSWQVWGMPGTGDGTA